MPGLMEECVRPLCHALVDEFSQAGQVDLVRQFNKRLPMAVICRLLGLPREDDASFERWAIDLIRYPWDPEAAQAASRQFTKYLEPLVEARRAAPEDDLLSSLCLQEVEGQRLTNDEIFSFVRQLFPAGADTTYLGLGSLMVGLLGTPGSLEELRGDLRRQAAAVEEAMRWEPPTSLLPRMTVQGGEFGGEELGADTVVLLGIAAANRDPEVFADPDRFDIGRETAGHLSFGYGNHFCIGSHLARAEMCTALEVLLERLEEIELLTPPIMQGAVLRGPDQLQIRFSPA